MPFVNIRILKGHSQERKDEMSRRVTAAISEVAQLPKEAIWVVFEDVTADDWYVGAARVSELAEGGGGESKDMTVEIRHPAFDVRRRPVGRIREARHRLPVHRGAVVERRGQVSAVQRHAGRPDPPLVRGCRRRRVPESEQQVERPDLGPPRQAAGLRARDKPRDTHRA